MSVPQGQDKPIEEEVSYKTPGRLGSHVNRTKLYRGKEYHLAEGFSDDCEELIKRWLFIRPKNYQSFCKLWKIMNFGTMYEGRQTPAEIIEVCEECLFIAKYYMIFPSRNIEESVAGLFLVYAILGLLPIRNAVSLRINISDLRRLSVIQMDAIKNNRMDVLYILGHVLIVGPVEYPAEEREIGFEPAIMKYYTGELINAKKFSFRGRDLTKEMLMQSVGVLGEAREHMKRYARARQRLPGYTNRKETLQKMLDEVEHLLYKIHDEVEEEEAQRALAIKSRSGSKRSSRGRAVRESATAGREAATARSTEATNNALCRAAIKERAMMTRVGGMKYLHSVFDEPSTSTPRIVAVAKEPPLNIGQIRPIKKIVHITKKRKYISSSSDSSSECEEEPLKVGDHEILIHTPDGSTMSFHASEGEDTSQGTDDLLTTKFKELIDDEKTSKHRRPKNILIEAKLKRWGILDVVGYASEEYLNRKQKKQLQEQEEAKAALDESAKKAEEEKAENAVEEGEKTVEEGEKTVEEGEKTVEQHTEDDANKAHEKLTAEKAQQTVPRKSHQAKT